MNFLIKDMTFMAILARESSAMSFGDEIKLVENKMWQSK